MTVEHVPPEDVTLIEWHDLSAVMVDAFTMRGRGGRDPYTSRSSSRPTTSLGSPSGSECPTLGGAPIVTSEAVDPDEVWIVPRLNPLMAAALAWHARPVRFVDVTSV